MRIRGTLLACASAALLAASPTPLAAEPNADARPPFTEQEIRFDSLDESAQLGGTLALPTGSGPFPAVVLLSVAGPNDRDQSVGNLKGYEDLARHLASQGIASVRLDDRGVGASTGNYFSSSWETFADDAGKAFDLLASHAQVYPEKIGFLGMSQGGAVGAMACQTRPQCAFLVLLSAPGLPGIEALRNQLETTLAISGTSEPVAEQYRALFDAYIGIVADDNGDPDNQRAQLLEFLNGPGRSLIPPYGFVPNENEALADMLLGDWYSSNLNFDPTVLYGALDVPVLAVGGGLDLVAPPDEHLDAIRLLLKAAPTRETSVYWFELGNHLLQTAETGLPTEYGTLDNSMAPEVMELASSWIAIASD